MSDLSRSLHLDQSQWESIRADQLLAKFMVVVFAYALIAFNRFGGLSFIAPRAATRLVLVGIYSWLALSAILWLVSRYTNNEGPTLTMTAVAVGSTHAPLLGAAVFVAVVAGFIQLLGPGLVASIVLVGVWMPALLVQATRTVTGLEVKPAVALGLGLHVIWLATTGRYLYAQVGDLL